ncbi:WXG100 family type VII secretion target [Micromonospora purpureochromogenes]|uniref:ESAT-6-like protein n=1 Tax=Micromonospora purpureochromogenes TaxID=47872 RepID=A0A1C5AIP2_9ACTN|nr:MULTISPECIES: WXG100 family type VII secretion target [Micromonospora]MBM0257840.1 WXG100 family type VII secretion target [Micromonospora sp. 4G55]MBQ0892616.1 WXG100 family type VII secretion target [Micromonospora sp. U56]MDH6463581.1 early secretory antigenic target protein ESAT-6 [Micromonospora sp. A200]NYF56631.1 WXG100 family type VII secretion target [Micromonospora purpureochromogenes]SCF44951.1 WXG100 family type VII secretion target [Micromonospora purpureochromogenes]
MSIKVDYAVLESANQQMQSISKTIDEKLDTLRSMLSKLQWDGQDRAAYEQHQAQWDTAVRDINRVLNEIGGAVGVARENYVSTEMSNSKVWG